MGARDPSLTAMPLRADLLTVMDNFAQCIEMQTGMRRLFVPLGGAWVATIVADVTPELERLLGPPHDFDEICDGLGPSDFWAYEFDCGLKLVIGKSPTGRRCGITADAPEVAHIARHLGLNLGQFDGALHSQPGYDDVARWREIARARLMRQDDNGNIFSVSELTSSRDAECLKSSLEKTMHKQTYWIDREGSV